MIRHFPDSKRAHHFDPALDTRMNEDDTLDIRDPWTMPYLEYEQTFIKALRKQIGRSHLLFGRDVQVLALRRDPDAVIYETVDEPLLYVLVFHSWSEPVVPRRGKNLKTEVLASREAVRQRVDKDHAEWKAQFSQKSKA